MSLNTEERGILVKKYIDKADYNILFEASEKDVIPNLSLAESFITEIESLIHKGKH